MKERKIPEGVSETVVCPVCGKPMTWKLSNVTDKFAWHCRNIDCSEYNPDQVDKEPAAATKPTSNIIKENCIHIFVEGGVVQDIIGIPKGEEVIVVDWDAEGVEPKNLTELEAGPAIVSIYRGESLHPDQPIDINKLIEYMTHRDTLECYIKLERGYKTSITIIKPDSEAETIIVFNELDGTEDEFKSLDAMAATHPGIHEALFMNKFYVYGYELGGC